MKKLAAIVLASVAWTIPILAQDSQYKPVNQQIPPPTCLTLKRAWELPIRLTLLQATPPA
jgi:hypothetical protein